MAMISLALWPAAILEAGHATAPSGSDVDWGDVPTWIAACAALAALVAAGLAWRTQSAQLADQRDANAKQGKALEAQLREIERRERVTQRQQADDVTAEVTSSPNAPAGTVIPEGHSVYAAEVTNGSRRPIRDVACRLKLASADALYEAAETGQLVEMMVPRGARVLAKPAQRSRIRLVKAGDAWLFIFRHDYQDHPGGQLTLRFTDDADLHWQIDHDLRLTPVEHRDW